MRVEGLKTNMGPGRSGKKDLWYVGDRGVVPFLDFWVEGVAVRLRL